MSDRIRVLAFGTYDILHEGHKHFLQQAKSLGDELHVIIALDETVAQVKGRPPHNSEAVRLAAVKALPFVDHALLGNPGDKYAVIEQIRPDIIALGYDQSTFTETLVEELNARGMNLKIVRFKEGHEPQTYKSSKMRPQ